ncbi:hypothetical protein [Effusibacillus consociatus]|uniref:Uncharacterized protein n=1 Tax=Effusibacillus consociatus TaxID=1117041 RepID=A0ABV9PWQ2_9BACL
MAFSWSTLLLVGTSLVGVCILGCLMGRFLAPVVPRKWARAWLLLPVAVAIAILHANLFHHVFHVSTDYLNHYFFFWWPLCHGVCRYHKRMEQTSTEVPSSYPASGGF